MFSTSVSRIILSFCSWVLSSSSTASSGSRVCLSHSKKSTDLPFMCRKAALQFWPFVVSAKNAERCACARILYSCPKLRLISCKSYARVRSLSLFFGVYIRLFSGFRERKSSCDVVRYSNDSDENRNQNVAAHA